MTKTLSIGLPARRPVQPHVGAPRSVAGLPIGAGDPAFAVRGPARFEVLPAKRSSRYAAVDAVVTFAAIAGFVAALGALGVEAASGEAADGWPSAVAGAIGPEGTDAVAQALGPISEVEGSRPVPRASL